MADSFLTLIVAETKEIIYAKALEIAELLDLPVSSWQPGDPTRSLIWLEAYLLEARETLITQFIRSAFVEYADDTWRPIVADQTYGVTVPPATYATTVVTLTNSGGSNRTFDPGDLVFKNSTTGKTYHNTSGGTLASGPATTLDVDVEADEAGSASTAAAGEIDELVTSYLGVTCTNAEAAIGTDRQDAATTIAQCRAKLSTLSLTGPRGGMAYVAREASLTGTYAITKARAFASSDSGDVTVYLAGPSGAVAEADRALVETAILRWATGFCITPTVLSAAAVTVSVTYELWIYKRSNRTATEAEAEVNTALAALIAALPIGGDIIPPATSGYLYQSLIESTIREVFGADAFRVSVSLPAGDTAITNGQVAALGTVTATINVIEDP
jgi:hypothetical protein